VKEREEFLTDKGVKEREEKEMEYREIEERDRGMKED
jgi:hypothetical protein